MKISIRKMFVLLAVALSLLAIQSVWAAEITVTGTIERIGAASIDVASDGTTYTFYDISLTDLATQGIVLTVGDSVTVSAYVVTFPNGTVKNIAYSITKGDVTYSWHPKVPKAGTTNTVTLSTTDENGQPCYCQCIENTVCLECNCYCGGRGR